MRYEILLFDADNTLFDFSKGEKAAFSAALALHGIPETSEHYPKYTAINHALWQQLEKGEITKEMIFQTRFALFAKECNIALDPIAVNADYKAALSEQAILMPHAEETLKMLKDRGYRLFIITNGDKTVQQKRLHKSGLLSFFEKVFISEELGHAKPSPLFFEAVANAILDFSKEKALVIGDSESSDILGANRYGIDACHITANSPPLSDQVFAKYQIHQLNELTTILLSIETDGRQ